jgi:hypothetical protein
MRGTYKFYHDTNGRGDPVAEAIISALENQKYVWRTVDGIVKETALDKSIVESALDVLGRSGVMVEATKPGTNEPVYTTRKRYKQTHNFFQLSVSALTNSIIF